MSLLLPTSLMLFSFLGADLSGATELAKESQLVEPFGELTQELVDDGQGDYLFPLKLMPGVDVGSLKLAPIAAIDVAHGQTHASALRTAFTPTLVSADARPVLKVHVDFKQVSRPGTYELQLGLSGTSNNTLGRGAAQQQYLTVKLTHPEAQLRATAGTWIIEKREPWLFFGQATTSPQTLELTETTGRSRVEIRRIGQSESPMHEEQPLSARVRPNMPIVVAAGSTLGVPFSLTEDFPAGITKGSFQLDGDQLKAPLLIPYEVRHRLPLGLVPLIFFLSALTGWLVRTHLRHAHERAKLLAQANELLVRIDEQLRSGLDESSLLALRDARNEVEENYSIDDGEKLTTAMQAADAALRNAIAERARQRQDLLIAVARALEAAQRRMVLPDELEQLCAGIAAALERVQREIVADNLAAAKQQQLEVDKQLRQLGDKIRQWGRSVQQSLRELDWPECGTLALSSEQREKIRGALEPLVQLDVTVEISMPDLLKPLHEALRPIENLAAELSEQLREAAGVASVALGLADEAGQELLQAAQVELADLSQPFAELQIAWSRQRSAILKAIRAAHPHTPPDMGQQLESLIQQGQIEEAVTLARSVRVRAALEGVEAAMIPNPRQSLSVGTSSAAEAASGLTSEERSSRLLVLDRVPTPLLVRRARSLRELRRASVLRSIGFAVLSTIAATLLYGGKFFGTWSEICALIAFGFTSDFTVGTFVEESIGRLKK